MIDSRTLNKRIESVLASNGVILKKMSHKLRCYMRTNSMEELSSIVSTECFSSLQHSKPTVLELRSMLDQLCARYDSMKTRFWNGKWSLSEEVAAVPEELWRDVILMIASNKKLRAWRITAKSTGVKLEDIFPVSNCRSDLPMPAIEEELNDPLSEYSRSDMLLSVRALKIIEQYVFSASHGVSGPLTTSLSIASIIELSPSFLSVMNSMGILLSYNRTERYRQKLIAERERVGPWDSSLISPASIPMFQFDNWDLKPLHAVKVDGKPMPKVNGSLLQGQSVKKESMSLSEVEQEFRLQKHSNWKETTSLGNREDFAEHFESILSSSVIEQFIDIVFGVSCGYRDRLLGGMHSIDCEYNTKTVPELQPARLSSPVNFRTLLLSCFEPHGSQVDCKSFSRDGHMVYVEINRESAADVLTVRRYLDLIEDIVKPGREGRPRYVVLSGDQPSYKYFVELWLESWRKEKRGDALTRMDVPLHRWLVPFPGFFHAEKQAMYSICKEMLDGLGLKELSSCCGLSSSQVDHILSHTHARNNRAVLFNLACALVIHLIDVLVNEDSVIASECMKLRKSMDKKRVSSQDPSCNDAEQEIIFSGNKNKRSVRGILFDASSELVTDDIINLGRVLRKKVESTLMDGANGLHFIGTVLFNCLLPTVGFHVVSRTGHTNLMDAFWFRHTAILHSTNHLKYQELSLFYGFIRGILPDVVVKELFSKKPGRSVMQLHSFTSGGRGALSKWGWAYVHLDEALEMLIVRHLKSLSVRLIGFLQDSAAWLLEVSKGRSLCRYMSGASRSFKRRRLTDDCGENPGPLGRYDRNALQWRNVARMIHIMRDCGFLNVEHRSAEWLTNVFCVPHVRMNIKRDQDQILNIRERGKVTIGLHASVLFPEVFGHLTDEDREVPLSGKKLKKWTKSRSVLRPRQSMSKPNGFVELQTSDGVTTSSIHVDNEALPLSRPNSKEKLVMIVSQRRKNISKLKDLLYFEQRNALLFGDSSQLQSLRSRWDTLHSKRHLISPFADCFFTSEGNLCHGNKSRMLRYTTRGNRDIHYPFNSLSCCLEQEAKVSSGIFDTAIEPYFSLQLDVMNALHYRGSTGDTGTSFESIIIGKMKRILRPWVTGRRSEELRQVHLHIDNADNVIPHKSAEQMRRDSKRREDISKLVPQDDEHTLEENEAILSFQDKFTQPWSFLIVNRKLKDEIASLHLICAGKAVMELQEEVGLHKSIQCYLHGGKFAIPLTFQTIDSIEYVPLKSMNHSDPVFDGSVVLCHDGSCTNDDTLYCDDYFVVRRNRALILERSKSVKISPIRIEHGESETRFISAFQEYVKLAMEEHGLILKYSTSSLADSRYKWGKENVSGSLILSNDTDVFLILLCNPAISGFKIRHVSLDNIHSLDDAIRRIEECGGTGHCVAMGYVVAGSDFTPSIFGIGHELTTNALTTLWKCGMRLSTDNEENLDNFEAFVCLLYLLRAKKTILCTVSQGKNKVRETFENANDVSGATLKVKKLKSLMFMCDHEVGTSEWIQEVRNYVSDLAVSANELVPASDYILLQAKRAVFVVNRYWSLSTQRNLCPASVGGLGSAHGYTADGKILLEETASIVALKSRIRELFTVCGCKGSCNSRRCSCVKKEQTCVGCGCNDLICENRVNCGNIVNSESGKGNEQGILGEIVCNEQLQSQTDLFESEMSPEINDENEDIGHCIIDIDLLSHSDGERSLSSQQLETETQDLIHLL